MSFSRTGRVRSKVGVECDWGCRRGCPGNGGWLERVYMWSVNGYTEEGVAINCSGTGKKSQV